MTLDLYYEFSPGIYAKYKEIDEDSDLFPVITTHDGVLGEIVEKRLFVHNDDPDIYFTNIVVMPVSISSPDDINFIDTGHGVKLCYGSIQPTEAEWTAIDYANEISFPDLGEEGVGDVSSYLPFWARFEVPAGSYASNRENISLDIEFIANAV